MKVSSRGAQATRDLLFDRRPKSRSLASLGMTKRSDAHASLRLCQNVMPSVNGMNVSALPSVFMW
jgi:hypothetical protein